MKRMQVYVVLIVLLQFFAPAVRGYSYEIDATASVDHITDGDTFATTLGDTIRLADIDAPEYYESGYYEATAYLTTLIDGKTVYLDIDDITRTDQYGRLVCIVYIDHNSTHLKNVNQAMLEAGHATIDNFTNNEFNPYEWTLYVTINQIPEFPPHIIIPLLVATALLTIIITRKMISKQHKDGRPENNTRQSKVTKSY